MTGLPLRDDPPFSTLLPHDVWLEGDDGALLLSTPRPRGATLALGCAWVVEPCNVEVAAEATCLHLARIFEGLLLGLPEGCALQVLLHVRPLADVPAWSALRPTVAGAALAAQRQALAGGLLHHDGGVLAGRLRAVSTRVTLRLSVPQVALSLGQRLRTACALAAPVPPSLLQALHGLLATTRAQLARGQAIVEDTLRAAGLAFQRQDGQALAHDLAHWLTPLAAGVPAVDLTQPLRTQVLTTPATQVPGGFQLGPLTTRVLSLRTAPRQTFPGMLSTTRTPPGTRPLALWEAWPAGPLALVVNVAVPPRDAELTRLRQKRALAFVQRTGLTGDVAPEKLALKEEIDTVLHRAFTAGDRMVWARLHVVAWGTPAEISQADDAVVQAGRRLGLEFVPEPVLGTTLFLHTLPLGFDPAFPEERFVRRARRLTSPNLAHLLPLYGQLRGTATPAALYLNRRGEAVSVDHFDVPTAPHAVIVGTSGSGKSFAVNHLVLQVLPLGAAVVILDRWASYEQLCTLVGGRYLPLDFNRPLCCNPFHGPLDRAHRAFLGALLAEMAAGGDTPVTREERAVLADTVAIFAQQQVPGQEPRLRDFVALLRQAPGEDAVLGRRLARALGPFVGDGPYAGFFDGANALTLDPVLTVVELSQLRDAPDLQAALMFVLLHHLTGFCADPARLEQRKYLICDETWALLRHPASASVLEEIARTFRKLSTSAIFLSQQVSDFATPAGKAITDNASLVYFLQQNPEEIASMRTVFALSDQEVALLQSVRRRPRWSEAYLRLPDQQGGVIRLVPDPLLRWLATQQPAERAAREAAVQAAGGDLAQAVATLAQQYPDGLGTEVPHA